MSRDKEIYMMGDSAYLKGSQTLVVTMMNDYDIGFIEDRKVSGNEVTPAKGSCTSKVVTFMPFGSDDKLPLQIMGKSGINTIVGSNIDFKAKLAYGDGLTMFRRVKDKTTGEIKVEEILMARLSKRF